MNLGFSSTIGLISRLFFTSALLWLSSVTFAHALCEAPDWSFRIAGDESINTMTVGSNEPCLVKLTWTAGATVVRDVTIISAPLHGSAEVIPESGVVYRSRPGYRGMDSFTFLISGHGASCNCDGTARVTFTVTVK